VDIELRRSMWDFLRDLNQQGITIILTTHYLEEAEMLCRHIGIINHGELIENTSMRNLLAKMQSETFIFDFIPTDEKPQLTGYNATLVDVGVLEVDVKRNQGLNQLFELFAQQGIKILSMRNKANRLEELFVHLVTDNQGATNE
jgi:ABC-2 type transport system ATP-binding protein